MAAQLAPFISAFPGGVTNRGPFLEGKTKLDDGGYRLKEQWVCERGFDDGCAPFALSRFLHRGVCAVFTMNNLDSVLQFSSIDHSVRE